MSTESKLKMPRSREIEISLNECGFFAESAGNLSQDCCDSIKILNYLLIFIFAAMLQFLNDPISILCTCIFRLFKMNIVMKIFADDFKFPS